MYQAWRADLKMHATNLKTKLFWINPLYALRFRIAMYCRWLWGQSMWGRCLWGRKLSLPGWQAMVERWVCLCNCIEEVLSEAWAQFRSSQYIMYTSILTCTLNQCPDVAFMCSLCFHCRVLYASRILEMPKIKDSIWHMSGLQTAVVSVWQIGSLELKTSENKHCPSRGPTGQCRKGFPSWLLIVWYQ